MGSLVAWLLSAVAHKPWMIVLWPAQAACFCAAQFLTSYLWGRISDRVGRKVLHSSSWLYILSWICSQRMQPSCTSDGPCAADAFLFASILHPSYAFTIVPQPAVRHSCAQPCAASRTALHPLCHACQQPLCLAAEQGAAAGQARNQGGLISCSGCGPSISPPLHQKLACS